MIDDSEQLEMLIPFAVKWRVRDECLEHGSRVDLRRELSRVAIPTKKRLQDEVFVRARKSYQAPLSR
jgi:hypothetical protein